MEVGNDIKLVNGQWSFYNGVAKHFDDHVKLSVPLYEEGHELICYLSDFFLKDNSVCYEIGSSTGMLIKKLYRRHHDKNNTTFYGIEPVKEMIEVAQSNDDTEIEYINDSIENVNMLSANLIVGYYFLQFIPISKRKEVIQKIYDSLVSGGGFILFEKELPLDPKIYKLMASSYMKFKIDHGFSPEEVLSKQFSLEGTMVTNTHSENRRLLSSVAFSHITTVMKYGEFNGYLCFK
ncbi:methyltransferase domain-containing protein [Streptococcus mutans]|uniref:Methyltransferase domain-containing protein n=2 Tax=Streptococcus mutans TaxID=1309 RepID=A0AAX1K1J6_STRMG|nr:methyltransferase domain-containing protein [Streptococcus mutans]QQL47006.1 methyltransferase domain-containing protein [Streptococcus mutans]